MAAALARSTANKTRVVERPGRIGLSANEKGFGSCRSPSLSCFPVQSASTAASNAASVVGLKVIGTSMFSVTVTLVNEEK